MKKFTLCFCISLCCILCNYSCNNQEEEEKQVVEQEEPVLKYGIDVSNLEVIESTYPKNKTLTEIFFEAGLPKTMVMQITLNCDSVLDVRKIKAGNPITTMLTKTDSTLQYFVYEINNIEYAIFDVRDSSNVQFFKAYKPVEVRENKLYGEITSSLWNALAGKDLGGTIAMELSEIFAWSVDFFGLQQGDWFKVVYTEELVDGKSVNLKSINYAVFNHQGKDYYAIPFEGSHGKIEFFDKDGTSAKKAFLKAPLKFARVSSGFTSARKHPVLRIVRPHYGVDYAAPVGTPVMAIGNGVVISKGYSGGAGNMVKIKHSNNYVSSYMHLSKYGSGIQQGTRVSQGQVIGYVGSTGLSTGPHLDFRIYHNGHPINPLKMVSPPSEPVAKNKLPQFNALRDSVVAVLNAIPTK
ncbi:MAG: peptidoglycan DD-metalloendopeptidase family protein [Bacteroidales bacterium]|jgi:murein DD-endopeptidase MepM/ murein hydrolase activator NlpD|nr:peptidoglycan DD-metalloendopeptidase family protein [Bacteroidales bacterium]